MFSYFITDFYSTHNSYLKPYFKIELKNLASTATEFILGFKITYFLTLG